MSHNEDLNQAITTTTNRMVGHWSRASTDAVETAQTVRDHLDDVARQIADLVSDAIMVVQTNYQTEAVGDNEIAGKALKEGYDELELTLFGTDNKHAQTAIQKIGEAYTASTTISKSMGEVAEQVMDDLMEQADTLVGIMYAAGRRRLLIPFIGTDQLETVAAAFSGETENSLHLHGDVTTPLNIAIEALNTYQQEL